MIPKEIIRKVRRIQITTSRKVTDVFAGQYQSVFKGAGMEFDEVREYLPGDEIRSIDWNVTARMGHPYIKKFVEERELTIMILLDVSMSCRFGTVNRMKSDLAAELCSVIAFSAIKNHDKVGMLTFTDRVEKFIPPRKGLKHVLRVVREAIYNKPAGKGTDIVNVLEQLNRVTSRRSIVFIVSDFISSDPSASSGSRPASGTEGATESPKGLDYKKVLSVTNKRHDVIAVTVTDPVEREFPKAGIVKLHDAETGEPFIVDTSSAAARELYKARTEKFFNERTEIFRSVKVDNIDIFTNKSYVDPLIRFFKMRERRMARR